jgi:hypothetical protein
MLTWGLALSLGLMLAALSYARLGSAAPRAVEALRVLAGTLAAALLLDAPLAPSRPLPPWVALDASASWTLDDSSAWRAALAAADSALAGGADSLLLVGGTVRPGPAPTSPVDLASRVGPLVEQARALGRPIVLVTDGRLEDAERLDELPRGSQVVVPTAASRSDLGVAELEAPGGIVVGDTLDVRILLRAGGAGSPARTLALSLAGREVATSSLEAVPAFGERELRLQVPVPALEGDQSLVASLNPTDAVAVNDRAEASVRVTGTASVALVSTAPDQDARFALAVLRGTQRAAVRAYWRVAPGQWREGDALRAVPEAVVRRAVEQASLVVLHGDTAYFGPPRSRARGALVLMAPADGGDEYYASAAGDSPLSAAIADLPWDQLPPVRVGAPVRGPSIPALLTRRARRGEERAVVSLREGTPRSVIVSAAGLWRWRTRGGRPGDAFDAVWGSIFDWVAADAEVIGTARERSSIVQELVPRPAMVVSGPVGSGPARDLAPRARSAWWLAALALLALCAEWMMRRRIGWR